MTLFHIPSYFPSLQSHCLPSATPFFQQLIFDVFGLSFCHDDYADFHSIFVDVVTSISWSRRNKTGKLHLGDRRIDKEVGANMTDLCPPIKWLSFPLRLVAAAEGIDNRTAWRLVEWPPRRVSDAGNFGVCVCIGGGGVTLLFSFDVSLMIFFIK